MVSLRPYRALCLLTLLPTIAGFAPTSRAPFKLPLLRSRAGTSTGQLESLPGGNSLAFTPVDLAASSSNAPPTATEAVAAPYVATPEPALSSIIVDAPPFELPPLPEEVAPAVSSASVPRLTELAAFALPMLTMWLSSPILSLIDTSVVGKFASTSALAALGPSTKLCDNIAYFASVVPAATTNLAAERFASGRADQATRIVASSLSISLAIGLIISVGLVIFASPLMWGMMGSGGTGSAAVAGSAIQYTVIRAIGFPFALATMVLQAAFLSRKDSVSTSLTPP